MASITTDVFLTIDQRVRVEYLKGIVDPWGVQVWIGNEWKTIARWVNKMFADTAADQIRSAMRDVDSRIARDLVREFS